MIPILTPPYPDELFISYITRLTRLNGFAVEKNFVGRVMDNISDSTAISHLIWNNDGAGIFSKFFNNVNINAFEIIHACSVYPFQAIFLTPNRQAMVVDTLFNNTQRVQKCFPLISTVKHCKECEKEDREQYGYSYIHRSHQLPGVTVCHKHHTPLWNENTPVEATPDTLAYATFAKDLLDAELQTNIDEIQQALLPYTDKLTAKQKTFLNKGLFLTKYGKIPEIIHILMSVFGSVKNLASSLSSMKDETIRKFLDSAISEYDVYEPFNATVIRMHHKSCGTTFFTTPAGFLAGWKCPHCTQKNEFTEKPFTELITDLVGDEYTIVSEYTGRNAPVEICHNKCGHTQTYLAKHFLNGSRCNHCVKIIPKERVPEIVSYVTSGQYHVSREGNNIFEITEAGGSVIEIGIPRFLQEVYRPTPSDILPVPVAKIQYDWSNKLLEKLPVRVSTNNYMDTLRSMYKPDELIFTEDLKRQLPEAQFNRIIYSIGRMVSNKKLFHIDSGIYALTPVTPSPAELLKQKYLVRNGKRIGIYYGQSLAYEMGLADKKPEVLYFITNGFGKSKGNIRTINGFRIHARGCPILINDDNYRYVMALEALKYCYVYGDARKYRIVDFIREHSLTIKMFTTILPYYSENVRRRFIKLWREYEQNNRKNETA